MIRPEIKQYIESEIIPRYDAFDRAHGRDHAGTVMARSAKLAARCGADPEIAFVAAAYHDTGLAGGREHHHEKSAEIVRQDTTLRRWFTSEQIETIAQAAEDHRASARREPRSIYGRIVAEADRVIDPVTIVRRTVQYGIASYPGLSREGQWKRTTEHLEAKYAEGGYMKLWIDDSPNAAPLRELRTIIADRRRLRAMFDQIYAAETSPEVRS